MRRLRTGAALLAAVTLAVVACLTMAGCAKPSPSGLQNVSDPATGFLLNGRQLVPSGDQVTLGNFPNGGAVTADVATIGQCPRASVRTTSESSIPTHAE